MSKHKDLTFSPLTEHDSQIKMSIKCQSLFFLRAGNVRQLNLRKRKYVQRAASGKSFIASLSANSMGKEKKASMIGLRTMSFMNGYLSIIIELLNVPEKMCSQWKKG